MKFHLHEPAAIKINFALQSLKSKLDILGMPTDQLIILFYSDFLDHQQKQSKAEKLKFGELLVSAGFVKGSSAIEVTVIHGENMGKFCAYHMPHYYGDQYYY